MENKHMRLLFVSKSIFLSRANATVSRGNVLLCQYDATYTGDMYIYNRKILIRNSIYRILRYRDIPIAKKMIRVICFSRELRDTSISVGGKNFYRTSTQTFDVRNGTLNASAPCCALTSLHYSMTCNIILPWVKERMCVCTCVSVYMQWIDLRVSACVFLWERIQTYYPISDFIRVSASRVCAHPFVTWQAGCTSCQACYVADIRLLSHRIEVSSIVLIYKVFYTQENVAINRQTRISNYVH